MERRYKLGLILVGFLLLGGCKTEPIYDVTAAPIPVMGKVVSLEDVTKAMMRAGTRAGWQMLPERPGRLTAEHIRGKHRALVDIEHDTKTYTIKYRDSTNLRSDGAQIHRLYNTWIQSLDRSIRAEMLQFQ
jgi:hypothetical protein